MPKPPCLVLGFAVLVLLGGCGGGGGDGDPLVFGRPHLLDGDYLFFAWQGVDGGPNVDSGVASWGPVASDGAGTLTGSFDQNAGGNTGGPIPFADPSTYTIDAAGTLRVLFATASAWDGGVSSDGALAVAGISTAAGIPGVFVLAKRSGAFSTASLDGAYHLGLVTVGRTTGTTAAWFAGTAIFNGAGVVSAAYDRNSEGMLATGLADAGTYAVQANGTLSWTFGAGPIGTGHVLEGGGLVLVTGAINGPEDPFFAVLVRKGTGVAATAWTGAYHAIGFERGGSDDFLSSRGTLSANGLGALTAAMVTNDGTTLTTLPVQGATFVVGPDGALTLNTGDVHAGAIAADGAYGFVTGPTGAGTRPGFTFFVR